MANDNALRTWLREQARIPEERIPVLLATLSEQWIDDVRTLHRCHAGAGLEKHLPAAAFQAIDEAIKRASPAQATPDELVRPSGMLLRIRQTAVQVKLSCICVKSSH